MREERKGRVGWPPEDEERLERPDINWDLKKMNHYFRRGDLDLRLIRKIRESHWDVMLISRE